MVARDKIERPARGFSVRCFVLYINELQGQVTNKPLLLKITKKC